MIRSALEIACLRAPRRRGRASAASITGTTIIAVARLRSRLSIVACGSNRRRTTSVEPSAIARIACAKPSAWNIGAQHSVVSRGAERDLAQQPADRRERARLGPRGALRRPGRAAREDDDLRRHAGLRRAPFGEPDPISASSVSAAGSSSAHARNRPRGGSTPSSMSAYSSS